MLRWVWLGDDHDGAEVVIWRSSWLYVRDAGGRVVYDNGGSNDGVGLRRQDMEEQRALSNASLTKCQVSGTNIHDQAHLNVYLPVRSFVRLA